MTEPTGTFCLETRSSPFDLTPQLPSMEEELRLLGSLYDGVMVFVADPFLHGSP